MVPEPVPGPDAGDLFAMGGEAGRLMAAVDWAATPLGPVQAWPAGLRFAIRTVLVSRLPMVLTWGPQFIQFYNDAYAPLIGAQHPAIGQDIRITFAAGWDAVLRDPVERAMTTLEPSWFPALQLVLERAGYREETYFNVTHAPAFAEDGVVGGMHAIGTEVTGQVIGARRQRLLHELSGNGGELGDEDQIVTAMCATLAGDPLDVPVAAVYLGDGEQHRLVATVGCDAATLPAVTSAGAGDVVAALEGLGLTGGPWGDRVTEAVALPLTVSRTAEPLGVLVVGRSPNLALDEEHRSFHELMARQFAGAVATSRAFGSERRRAESLAELDRAKTTFFADVSHELRTPLTLLLGPIRDVLEDAEHPLTQDVREQLALAMRNGQRLQRLVNDLLDVAGIEAGRANPVRVETDVATFTADLAGIFRSAAERAGLRLTVDSPPLSRPACVDPRMWEKVVVNLLANAVKYTFVGGIDVRLREDSDSVVLTVSDTGVGIVAEELPRLFERFHRVAGATARTREGTGIGLALVHELVGLHGGAVSVTSEPGAGSAFTVTLPFGAPDAEAVGGPAVTPSEAARGEAADWEQAITRPTGHPGGAGAELSAGADVLVVDDNADMRAYLTRLLAPYWSVRTTADGEEALRAVAERTPSVVLTDVMMPRVDGFELLRALRSDPATAGIPVIMLTARAGQEASVEGLEAGADDYLAKPFQASELLARVRVALDRAAGRRSPAGPARQADGPPAGGTPAHDAPAPPPTVPPEPAANPGPPLPRPPGSTPGAAPEISAAHAQWRFPSQPSSVPVLRRRLRGLLDGAGVHPDQAYDLLLAACEAATNAVEHAQAPARPYVDVTTVVGDGRIRVVVRDYGQWRGREASMDRGRGSTLMSAFAEISATPSPEGTTVVIGSALTGLPSAAASG